MMPPSVSNVSTKYTRPSFLPSSLNVPACTSDRFCFCFKISAYSRLRYSAHGNTATCIAATNIASGRAKVSTGRIHFFNPKPLDNQIAISLSRQ